MLYTSTQKNVFSKIIVHECLVNRMFMVTLYGNSFSTYGRS